MSLVLGLDQAGTPHRWINIEEAAIYYAKETVAWEAGSSFVTLRGGVNARSNTRSELNINSIIAVKGDDYVSKTYTRTISISRRMLFKRDLNMCAYCGSVLDDKHLELEHVIPKSRGGKTSWTNIVSACRYCNSRKDARTPEEAGMELLYVPYIPNRHEAFILANRNILADQMAFLLLGVPKHSRLLA
jgi:hypothetical protein